MPRRAHSDGRRGRSGHPPHTRRIGRHLLGHRRRGGTRHLRTGHARPHSRRPGVLRTPETTDRQEPVRLRRELSRRPFRDVGRTGKRGPGQPRAGAGGFLPRPAFRSRRLFAGRERRRQLDRDQQRRRGRRQPHRGDDPRGARTEGRRGAAVRQPDPGPRPKCHRHLSEPHDRLLRRAIPSARTAATTCWHTSVTRPTRMRLPPSPRGRSEPRSLRGRAQAQAGSSRRML
jgi:hypothetical protein